MQAEQPKVTEPTISLSIIIATYNAGHLLSNCLASICRNPPTEAYEIIVIDDASTDGTREMVLQRFPQVRLLSNRANRHYSYSNNLAFECAAGQYFCLLNSDTVVLPNALDKMISFLRMHSDAGVVGSKLLNEDGTIQWSVKTLPNMASALVGARSWVARLFPTNPYSRRHLLNVGVDLKHPIVAGYVSSACMMVPWAIVKRVGGLDPRLSYHVDADYCKRITDLGYKCYYLPSAAVVHLNHKGGTMVSFKRRLRSVLEFHLGSYIFYRKHINRVGWGSMQFLVLVGLSVRFVLAMLFQMIAETCGALAAVACKVFVPKSLEKKKTCPDWNRSTNG
jgi:GT2 family glycosyltransferase